MVRSMYSGVAGMRAHQTRMDTIGNNIANVNTNGFKSSRVTFRDIYYQNLRGAAAATASKGGINPSQVGVGGQVASIDVLQTRSTFTQTDYAMDVAIDGEGFLQIQDVNGNKYFTRAGQLGFDSAGNLVDSKGNFVLGTSGNPIGKSPSSDLIQVSLPAAQSKTASGEIKVNDTTFSVTTSKASKDGNVGVQFTLGSDMAIDEEVKADVGTNGIVVYLNPDVTFADMASLSQKVNDAIQAASREQTGQNHPAGDFTFTTDKAFSNLKGSDICGTDYGVKKGTMTGWDAGICSGFRFSAAGEGFTAGDAADDTPVNFNSLTVLKNADDSFAVSANINGQTYSGAIPATMDKSGKMRLYRGGNTNSDDYVEVTFPKPSDIKTNIADYSATDTAYAQGASTDEIVYTPANATPALSWTINRSEPSKAIGLSSKKFALTGGNEGGPQGIENLTNIQIGTDGVIIGEADGVTTYIGRIDLVTHANPSGLAQAGSTYFTESVNSGPMAYCVPGTDGSGQLVSGSLELSNVDLSREFSDMISTQRGYQANSRIITVSDTMLEELVNLKR